MSGVALACAMFTMNPRFSQPRFRKWRATMYVVFGFLSTFFIMHGLVIYGWATQSRRMSLDRMAWTAIFNLIGATAYATRASLSLLNTYKVRLINPMLQIPEKHWPCQFDILGSSHQIFHLAVLIAACVHYDGLIRAFEIVRA